MTLQPRGRMFNEGLNLDSPKCNQYSPQTSLTQSSRFAKPTFGFGTKMDLAKPQNEFPGPGTYSPPSFIDKFQKKNNFKKLVLEN